MSLIIPKYWQSFRDDSNILKLDIEIPEESDLSGIGADIEFFEDDSILDEMNNSYPGLIVQKDGFMPVGGCQVGTGDPYFIRLEEGVGGSLYQIYHDEVLDNNYSQESAIAVILKDYREILKFCS